MSDAKWILVSEELPEPGQAVFYFFDVVGVWAGWFRDGTSQRDAVFYCDVGQLHGDATHWMPRSPGQPTPEKPSGPEVLPDDAFDEDIVRALVGRKPPQ